MTDSKAYPSLERVPGKQNWVDRAGGLPSYIERIAKHLHYEKGYDIGRSIAIAVNACKRMCGSGDLNFKGVQNVNAKSRAQACNAIKEWEAKKMKARVKKGVSLELSDEEFEELASEFLGEDVELAKHGHKGQPGYHLLHPKSRDGSPNKPFSRKSSGASRASGPKKINGRKNTPLPKKYKVRMETEPRGNGGKDLRRMSDDELKTYFQQRSGKQRGPALVEMARRGFKPKVDASGYSGGKYEYEPIKSVKKRDDIETEFTIVSKNDEKQLVFGYASMGIDHEGKILVDKQGDVIDDPDEMERAAYRFVMHSRDGGEMHIRKGVSTLVESFVVTPEKLQAMSMVGELPEEVIKSFPQAAWWVGFKVHDPEVWEKVKKRKYPMFSVHGKGVRKAIEEGGE